MRNQRLGILLTGLLLAGCVTKGWKPQWDIAAPIAPVGDARKLLTEARKKYGVADTDARLRESIAAYLRVL